MDKIKILVVDKASKGRISWLPGETGQFFPTEKFEVKVATIKPEAIDFLYLNPDTSIIFLDYRNYNEVDYGNICEIIQHIRSTDEIKKIPVVTIVSLPDERLTRGVLKNGSDFIVYKETIKDGTGSVKIFSYMLKIFLEVSSLRKQQNQQ